MASLNIRVGCSVDRNLAVAYRPLVEAAKKAKQAIDAESKQAARAISTNTKKGVDDAEAKFRELAKEIETGMPRATNVSVAAIRQVGKEAATSFAGTKRQFADFARDAERQLSRISRASKESLGSRAFSAAGGMDGVRAGLSRSVGIVRAGAGAALGFAGNVAHGLGVNTDLASILHKNVDLEAQAVALSNASVIKEDPRNANRVDPKELMRQVLDTSKKTGTDANTTLEGLRKFVDLTGDLATGREILGDLEMLAKATGTSMEDMVSAAGELNLALGNTPNKAEEIKKLMNQIAAQGERGAVPIRTLAPNLAKVAAAAGQFEGKRADNIALFTAMAQEARKEGGANSTASAATSVASFVNTLKTPARANAFKAATGKSVFNAEGKIRNPEELIMEALRAKGMDPQAFKKIFANVQGARAVEGLATRYREAGGGAAGEAEARKALDSLKGVMLDEEQIRTSFNASMQTSEAQANQFNNAMREAVLKLQADLIPAMIKLAPAALAVAKAFGATVEWIAKQTGASGAAEDTNNVNATLAAEQRRVDLKHSIASGKIDPAELADAQKKIADLDQKIAEKKKNAETEPTGWDEFTALLKSTFVGGGAGADALDEKADRAREDKRQLASMEETRSQLASTVDAIKNGVLKVEIVADRTAAAGGPPGKPTSGRQPSPEERAEK